MNVFLELKHKNKKQNANKKRRRENPLFRKRDLHHINHGKNVFHDLHNFSNSVSNGNCFSTN